MTNEFVIGDLRLGTGVAFQNPDGDAFFSTTRGEGAFSKDWSWFNGHRVDYTSDDFPALQDFVSKNFGVVIPENFHGETLELLVGRLRQAQTAARNTEVIKKDSEEFATYAQAALDLLQQAEHVAQRLGAEITDEWAQTCFVRQDDKTRFAEIMTGMRAQAQASRDQELALLDYNIEGEVLAGTPPVLIAGPAGGAGAAAGVARGVLASRALAATRAAGTTTRAAVSLPGAVPTVATETAAATRSTGVVAIGLGAVGLGAVAEWGAKIFADNEPTYTVIGPASEYQAIIYGQDRLPNQTMEPSDGDAPAPFIGEPRPRPRSSGGPVVPIGSTGKLDPDLTPTNPGAPPPTQRERPQPGGGAQMIVPFDFPADSFKIIDWRSWLPWNWRRPKKGEVPPTSPGEVTPKKSPKPGDGTKTRAEDLPEVWQGFFRQWGDNPADWGWMPRTVLPTLYEETGLGPDEASEIKRRDGPPPPQSQTSTQGERDIIINGGLVTISPDGRTLTIVTPGKSSHLPNKESWDVPDGTNPWIIGHGPLDLNKPPRGTLEIDSFGSMHFNQNGRPSILERVRHRLLF